MLADLLSPRSGVGQLVRSDLKAALLGGPILGGLLAASTVLGNRPVLGPSDAMVLWLYFGVLAGAALFALDLVAALLVTALARRRGARSTDARRAALLVGLPTLGYLGLLWASRRQDGGLAADLLFLGAAVAATLLVAWLAGLVSLAGIIGRTGEVPDRKRRPAVVLGLVLVPVAAAFLLFAWVVDERDGPRAAAPFVPPKTGARLVFVGVDGLDAELVEALSDRGAVDHLLAGMARGAVWPKTRPAGLEPPEVWTTLLTGMPAAVHGVRTVGSERLPGVAVPLSGRLPIDHALRFLLPTRTIPTTGAGRTVRTLWEIVGLRQTSAAVGWWSSWPARDDEEGPRGYVVSDRVLPKLLSGGAEDRDTAPDSLWMRLGADFPRDRAAIRREFDARFPRVEDPGGLGGFERFEPSQGAARVEIQGLLWESFLIDAYAWMVHRRLLSDPTVRAGFVYLPGLDILRHRLLEGPAAGGVTGLLRTQESLEGYVRWLDEVLGRALEPQPGTRVLVVADPGRSATSTAEGFVVAAGIPRRAGCVGDAVSDLDVAPLALTLLGYPASVEMPGAVPSSCLEPAPVGPPRIATYGRRGVPARHPVSAYDPEMVERLKSLGYLR